MRDIHLAAWTLFEMARSAIRICRSDNRAPRSTTRHVATSDIAQKEEPDDVKAHDGPQPLNLKAEAAPDPNNVEAQDCPQPVAPRSKTAPKHRAHDDDELTPQSSQEMEDVERLNYQIAEV